MGLCHDKEILYRDIVGQAREIFFRDRVGLARSFLSRQRMFGS